MWFNILLLVGSSAEFNMSDFAILGAIAFFVLFVIQAIIARNSLDEDRDYTSEQCLAGKSYYLGNRDTSQNYKQAAYWFQKAANQGDPKAQYLLGKMYEQGKGIPKNRNKAIFWLEKAEREGIQDSKETYVKVLKAIGDIGELEQVEEKPEYTEEEKKLKQRERVETQFALGLRYYSGYYSSISLAESYKRSTYWFRKAAAQGHLEAKDYLKKLHIKNSKLIERQRANLEANRIMENATNIIKIISPILIWGAGIIQVLAVVAGVAGLLDVHWIVAGILTWLVYVFLPFPIPTVIGFSGAMTAWGWPFLAVALLFFWPWLLGLLVLAFFKTFCSDQESIKIEGILSFLKNPVRI